MELNNDGDVDLEDVTMVPSPDADATEQVAGPASKKTSRTSSQLAARMARDNSVDMLSEEGPGQSSQSNVKSPLGTHPPMSASAIIIDREPLPPLEEQIVRIESLAQNMELAEGAKGYIISNEWLEEVQNGGDKSTHAQGPVDNRPLLADLNSGLKDEEGEDFYPLKPGLIHGTDIQILPQEAWDLILKWYGMVLESPPIVRYCHNTSTGHGSENLQFEFYPPTFTVVRLVDPGAGKPTLTEQTKRSVKVAASRADLFQDFLRTIKRQCGISMASKVRVWRILEQQSTASQQTIGMMTPAQSRDNSPGPSAGDNTTIGNALFLDVEKFLALSYGSQRELLEDAHDETNNANYNGRSNLDLIGLGQEGLLVLEPRISGPAGGEWVTESAGVQNGKKGFLSASAANGKTRSNAGSGRSSPAPMGAMMTRGRAKNGRTRGTVGLGNLGNTCYMNSALQCVRSVKELTDYFLDGRYKKELNPSNPLAHDGQVAKAYADLLNEIYIKSSGNSFSPRNFKNIIGRYGPSFSGYGQQDSQEFLLFLLDGLQEDLNRIHKKPYIEKPDSTDEMVHNKVELAKFADECWRIYKARNDSVITDLFAGMYKSTVTCPVCDKVSIIFDPFNNLTLQLPVENIWSRRLTYYPPNLHPLDIQVEVDKNSSIAQLTEYIGKKVSVDPKRLIVAEIYQHRFYKVFEPNTILAEERIATNDQIVVIEVDQIPTNYPPTKRKKFTSIYGPEPDDLDEENSALSERLLVPVFHRVSREAAGLRGEQKMMFGEPSYIVLNRKEACDYELIFKKVLARVATMTTSTEDVLGESDLAPLGDGSSQGNESDSVLMNNDTDTSSDSKVHVSSVQGEDGMVDISMKDRLEPSEAPHRSHPPGPLLHKPLPAMLHPDAPPVTHARMFFEMKYFKAMEQLPTGWNTFQDANKPLPSVESRLQPRKAKKQLSQGEKLDRAIRNGEFGSDDDDDELDRPPPQTHFGSQAMDSLSSDEDEEIPTQPYRAPRDDDVKSIASEEGTSTVFEAEVSEPLIRLGEAIVLDWKHDAFDALFNGNDSDDMRGISTEKLPRPLLPDPEQDQKSMLRRRRQKDGVTLDDCLDEFGKEETLSENDAWYCPKCKEHRRASKKFELWKVPDVLVVHLKRFSAQGRFRDKLDLLVDFPTEGLDLSKRVAVSEGKELIYDLFAVDNHYGGLGGGHYTAFTQNFNDGSWYEYNDSIASKRFSAQPGVTSAAYLLFYRRRSEEPLGGPFFESMYADIENALSPSVAGSASASRAHSPSSSSYQQQQQSLSGEGRRLDDASRPLTGSSSASHRPEAGAARQVGGGGLLPRDAAAASAGAESSQLQPQASSSNDNKPHPAVSAVLAPGMSIQRNKRMEDEWREEMRAEGRSRQFRGRDDESDGDNGDIEFGLDDNDEDEEDEDDELPSYRELDASDVPMHSMERDDLIDSSGPTFGGSSSGGGGAGGIGGHGYSFNTATWRFGDFGRGNSADGGRGSGASSPMNGVSGGEDGAIRSGRGGPGSVSSTAVNREEDDEDERFRGIDDDDDVGTSDRFGAGGVQFAATGAAITAATTSTGGIGAGIGSWDGSGVTPSSGTAPAASRLAIANDTDEVTDIRLDDDGEDKIRTTTPATEAGGNEGAK